MNKIIQGDCIEEMKNLPDNSVDAIITDPPFAFTGGISNGSSANISGQFFSFCIGIIGFIFPIKIFVPKFLR